METVLWVLCVFVAMLFGYVVIIEKRQDQIEENFLDLINHFNIESSKMSDTVNALSKKMENGKVLNFKRFSVDPERSHYVPSKDIDTQLKGTKLDIFD